jgi:hypothetical protein
MWYLWRIFYKGMKEVSGYKSLDTLNYDLNNLEKKIRNDNEIPVGQEVTLENSKKSDKVKFLEYYTLKHFSEKGNILKQASETFYKKR